MTYKYVLYEEDGEIGILTLNRPEVRNAVSKAMEEEMMACLSDAAERAAAKVIIIKAAGEIFSSGHDREEIINKDLSTARRLMHSANRFTILARSIPQCLIAQVQGIAMAGGCHLAACCDLVTAGEEKAKFGLTGLLLSFSCSIPTVTVSRAVPSKRCLEMLMTARLLSAREAYDIHLVNHVFPDNKLDDLTYELAKDICKSSKYGIYMAKQVFYSQLEMTEWQALQYTKEMMSMSSQSVNAQEGFRSFLEKRKPVWDESTCF